MLPRNVLVAPPPERGPLPGAPASLGLYRHRDIESDIEITGLHLDYEIDPADVLEKALADQAKTIVSRHLTPSFSGASGDFVATWSVEERPFVGRFYAAKWGARLYIVSCRAPAELYSALAESMAVTVASLTPLAPDNAPLAVASREIKNAVPAPWTTRLPETWLFEPDICSDDVVSFQALQLPSRPTPHPDMLFGKLSFAAMARREDRSAADVAHTYVRALREKAVLVAHDEFKEEAPPQGFSAAWGLVAKAERLGQLGEVRCRVLLHDRAWFIAGVLGPTKQDGSLAWMQNKRVLDVVTRALEVEVL
jgi:hypothetical protein